ncbi:phage tail protein [Escherichia coli]|uniref:phage tail fiber protein n=1 Tax=Escherichia coli TaxID=562 RepID=UPI00225B2402|nr:phage tail protein [Escherichia coli]MCX3246320.1 phage tail protein [Escherichia coli]
MSAGTLTLTNNSDAVTGSGTAFTTELAAGDFIVVKVGGVPYTLPIKTVNSNTSLTLVSNFTGPTQSGAAWSAVPRVALNMVTAALVAQSAEALRGLNYDKQNWQQVFSGAGDITVTMPDGTQYSGPSWPSIVSSVSGKLSSDATTLRKLFTAAFVNPGDNWPYPGVTTYDNNLWGSPNRWGTVLTLSNHDVSGNGADGRWYSYLQIDTSGNFAVAANINNTFFGVYRVWTTKNTTVDSNGFIKRASPIVKVYGDGASQTNSESDGATVTREDIGVYRISGVMGMNSDRSWGGNGGGVEVPKDINGQPRVWVDYDIDPDGSIILRTYHRTHPDAPAFARNLIGTKDDAGKFTETVLNGEPIDIPDDVFISVRVEMPADSLYNQKIRAAELAMTTDDGE